MAIKLERLKSEFLMVKEKYLVAKNKLKEELKRNCKKCNGTGEYSLHDGQNYHGDSHSHTYLCDCVAGKMKKAGEL